MSAQHDQKKACNLFPCREKLDMTTAAYLRELASSDRCHLCVYSGCDKEASKNQATREFSAERLEIVRAVLIHLQVAPEWVEPPPNLSGVDCTECVFLYVVLKQLLDYSVSQF